MNVGDGARFELGRIVVGLAIVVGAIIAFVLLAAASMVFDETRLAIRRWRLRRRAPRAAKVRDAVDTLADAIAYDQRPPRCGHVMRHGAPCVRHVGHGIEHRDSQGSPEACEPRAEGRPVG